eukprot:s4859_g2.t1
MTTLIHYYYDDTDDDYQPKLQGRSLQPGPERLGAAAHAGFLRVFLVLGLGNGRSAGAPGAGATAVESGEPVEEAAGRFILGTGEGPSGCAMPSVASDPASSDPRPAERTSPTPSHQCQCPRRPPQSHCPLGHHRCHESMCERPLMVQTGAQFL